KIADDSNALNAPMQGTIVSIAVSAGDTVEAGDTLAVIEAMKMEQPLKAGHSGTVSEVLGDAGAAVKSGEAILRFAAWLVNPPGPPSRWQELGKQPCRSGRLPLQIDPRVSGAGGRVDGLGENEAHDAQDSGSLSMSSSGPGRANGIPVFAIRFFTQAIASSMSALGSAPPVPPQSGSPLRPMSRSAYSMSVSLSSLMPCRAA